MYYVAITITKSQLKARKVSGHSHLKEDQTPSDCNVGEIDH